MYRRNQGMPPMAGYRNRADEEEEKQFDQFEASSLFCVQCKQAVPVRKRLLLVVPGGERYEYLCAQCGFSVGRKEEQVTQKAELIYKP